MSDDGLATKAMKHLRDGLIFIAPDVIHVASSTYPRSRQYRTHIRISSAEPNAIPMKRRNSAFEYDCFPNPSARLAQMDLLARRT